MFPEAAVGDGPDAEVAIFLRSDAVAAAAAAGTVRLLEM